MQKEQEKNDKCTIQEAMKESKSSQPLHRREGPNSRHMEEANKESNRSRNLRRRKGPIARHTGLWLLCCFLRMLPACAYGGEWADFASISAMEPSMDPYGTHSCENRGGVVDFKGISTPPLDGDEVSDFCGISDRKRKKVNTTGHPGMATAHANGPQTGSEAGEPWARDPRLDQWIPGVPFLVLALWWRCCAPVQGEAAAVRAKYRRLRTPTWEQLVRRPGPWRQACQRCLRNTNACEARKAQSQRLCGMKGARGLLGNWRSGPLRSLSKRDRDRIEKCLNLVSPNHTNSSVTITKHQPRLD